MVNICLTIPSDIICLQLLACGRYSCYLATLQAAIVIDVMSTKFVYMDWVTYNFHTDASKFTTCDMETAIIRSVQITKHQPELWVRRVTKVGVEEMVEN